VKIGGFDCSEENPTIGFSKKKIDLKKIFAWQ
jgi:hypothetical protein